MLEAKLPRRQFCEQTGHREYCRRCKGDSFDSPVARGVTPRLVEMVFVNDTQANCPICHYGFEWPRPASESYEDKPWKCPKCHGVIAGYRGISLEANPTGGTDLKSGDATYRCTGFPDTDEGRAMSVKAFGERHADTLWTVKARDKVQDKKGNWVDSEAEPKTALPREGCGWTGLESEYGKSWR